MAPARTTRVLARASLGALAAAGLLFGAVGPAGAATPDHAATPDPTARSTSTVDPLGGCPHCLKRESQRLLKAINQARLHPELYPPHGNTAGAARTACRNELHWSADLYWTAREHNKFLAGKRLDWAKTYPNMYRSSDGKFVWEPGGPIDRAGYHSFRSEIISFSGASGDDDIVRSWMQDDAASHWRNRNLILNCAIQEAGPGYRPRSSADEYQTVDMGNR
jgi:hypothetical protein